MEQTETMLDHAPDPVQCPDCYSWVRPFYNRDVDLKSLNCPECGWQCCAIHGWPEEKEGDHD
jgi:hypothetical protein